MQALMLTIAAGSAATVPPLPPLAAWRVGYEDSMCILSRPFGANASPVTLAFRRTPLDYENTFTVVLMTPPDKRGALFGAQATLTLAPSGASVQAPTISAILPDGSARLSMFTIAGDAVDGVAQAQTVTIAIKGLPTVSVAPTATAAALRALDQCGRDVAVRWGVPIGELEAIGTPPTPKNIVGAFGADAYPPEAIRRGETGSVTTLLSLDVQGRVTDCAIKASSGHRSLDDASCARVTRVGHTPALDRSGAPMASHAALRVIWVLPGGRMKK